MRAPPPVVIESLHWPTLNRLGLHTFVRRDDQLPYSGNKYYKLYLNIQRAIATHKSTLVSCGGAYSNHIHALAKAGFDLEMPTVGIIRGYQPKQLSPTLKDAQNWGMELVFAKPSVYKKQPLSVLDTARRQQSYWIPEGAANLLAVKGAGLISRGNLEYFNGQAHTACIASATGTTLAGMIASSDSSVSHIGFNVLKGRDLITEAIRRILLTLNCSNWRWQIISGFHCGGYAKLNNGLSQFIERFEDNAGFAIEPVYTGKMLFAMEQLAKRGYWSKGSHLLAIHTGGLQGRRGFPNLD